MATIPVVTLHRRLSKLPKAEDSADYIDTSFVRHQSFLFYEGWLDSQAQLRTRRGEVPYTKLDDFLLQRRDYSHSNNASSTRFRVISFPRIHNGRNKVAIPRPAFEAISLAWNLHHLTMESFITQNGLFADFDNAENTSLLLRVPGSREMGLDCISVSHNKRTNTIYALCHSLGNEDSFFEVLDTHPERCLEPVTFPAVLYRCHQRYVEVHRRNVDDALMLVERGSKLGGPGRLFVDRNLPEESTGAADFAKLAESLSYVQTEIAIINNCVRLSVDYGKWLCFLAEKGNPRGAKAGDIQTRSAALEAVEQETRFVLRLAMTAQSQIQHLHDRAQSQSTFLLNRMAQNEAAATSAIAADSKRDSTAVKIIAILTMLFLPGTFVATFFSMTMFDWNIGNGTAESGIQVSSYIWVYWVVTIPLTALVMGCWILWNRKEESRLAAISSTRHLHRRQTIDQSGPEKAVLGS
jgi:hypothetical protein